jgi:hypothetical protein
VTRNHISDYANVDPSQVGFLNSCLGVEFLKLDFVS